MRSLYLGCLFIGLFAVGLVSDSYDYVYVVTSCGNALSLKIYRYDLQHLHLSDFSHKHLYLTLHRKGVLSLTFTPAPFSSSEETSASAVHCTSR